AGCARRLAPNRGRAAATSQHGARPGCPAAAPDDFERWAAELLESHISYPVLAYFRSQHVNQSWLGALTTLLDASALVMVGIEGGGARQAQLTFAIARHAVVDLAQGVGPPPRCPPAHRP